MRYRHAMDRRLAPAAAALALLLAACAASPSTTASPTPGAPSESVAPSGIASAEPTPVVPRWEALGHREIHPAAREDHTWTATPDGATAYLFGGRGTDGAAFGDLWAFDLATDAWSPVETEGGPPARFGHNAAWVTGVGLVIFAGQTGTTFFNDLWAYDPAEDAWSQLPAGGAVPVARYGSCAAIGPDGRLWISHGFTSEGSRFADTRAYDFATATWTDETPAGDLPVSRCLHGCWWTDDRVFTLYAGQTTGVTALDDWWTLIVGERPGTNIWTRVLPAAGVPPDRNLYAAARWGAGTLIFGGTGNDTLRSDTWWLSDDGAATLLLPEDAGPSRRYGAEMVADPDRGRVLLFGGTDELARFEDTWQLTLPLP
jgi:hypothetical protein